MTIDKDYLKFAYSRELIRLLCYFPSSGKRTTCSSLKYALISAFDFYKSAILKIFSFFSVLSLLKWKYDWFQICSRSSWPDQTWSNKLLSLLISWVAILRTDGKIEKIYRITSKRTKRCWIFQYLIGVSRNELDAVARRKWASR